MRVALLIQYDGSNYYGWQVQKDPNTVQGILEQALKTLYGQTIGVVGSGRTDSGVHALGQVAHFDIEASSIPHENICKALNRELADDIRITASQQVSDEFHSRFKAAKREYRYIIRTEHNVLSRNSQWQVRFPLDIEKLHKCSKLILGTHDFSSFCFAGTETENMICIIEEAQWRENPDGSIQFDIAGNRFLHHMVRMLVGTMVEVARGKWSLDDFLGLLDNPNRQAHAVTAPARGLALMKVNYPSELQPTWKTAQEKLDTLHGKG